MAESSTITRERGPLGHQFELRALNGDVLQGALPQAAELYAPIWLLMTAQHYQSFAVASQAHAAADLHAPQIPCVDHRTVAPSPPAQCRCTVQTSFISFGRMAITHSGDSWPHSLRKNCATQSRISGDISSGTQAYASALKLIPESLAPLRIREIGLAVAHG